LHAEPRVGHESGAGTKQWLKQQPLSELLETLDPARFVRVHRSFAIALERIARIQFMA